MSTFHALVFGVYRNPSVRKQTAIIPAGIAPGNKGYLMVKQGEAMGAYAAKAPQDPVIARALFQRLEPRAPGDQKVAQKDPNNQTPQPGQAIGLKNGIMTPGNLAMKPWLKHRTIIVHN